MFKEGKQEAHPINDVIPIQHNIKLIQATSIEIANEIKNKEYDSYIVVAS